MALRKVTLPGQTKQQALKTFPREACECLRTASGGHPHIIFAVAQRAEVDAKDVRIGVKKRANAYARRCFKRIMARLAFVLTETARPRGIRPL
jgi:hypothetical protein